MTEITNPTEQEIISKKQQFAEQLENIDAKYQIWFSNRIHPFTGEKDTIQNYFRYFTTSTGQVQLHLKDGLPIEINKDCRLAFENIF